MASERLLTAARFADWVQVRLNGGPPCFWLAPDDNRFCLRAQRWEGHDSHHQFTTLEAALLSDSTPTEGGA